MCLILFAWQQHPDYPLIAIANRDEYYARPSRDAQWWEDSDIYAGRDIQAGGTCINGTCTCTCACTKTRRRNDTKPARLPVRLALRSRHLGCSWIGGFCAISGTKPTRKPQTPTAAPNCFYYK